MIYLYNKIIVDSIIVVNLPGRHLLHAILHNVGYSLENNTMLLKTMAPHLLPYPPLLEPPIDCLMPCSSQPLPPLLMLIVEYSPRNIKILPIPVIMA